MGGECQVTAHETPEDALKGILPHFPCLQGPVVSTANEAAKICKTDQEKNLFWWTEDTYMKEAMDAVRGRILRNMWLTYVNI
jgi:hypothetical protein